MSLKKLSLFQYFDIDTWFGKKETDDRRSSRMEGLRNAKGARNKKLM